MAFLGLRVPHEIARLFAQIDYGDYGEPESVDTYHVTVAYFGEDVPIERLAGIITAAYKVASGTHPFTIRTDHVTTFPPHPVKGTVPVICRMICPELVNLHDALLQQFDADGVEYSNNFPDYHPHMTLAYVGPDDDHIEEARQLNMKIPNIEWGVGELVLWGGDSGDDRLVVSFPFALAPPSEKKAALYRAMVLVARLRQGRSNA